MIEYCTKLDKYLNGQRVGIFNVNFHLDRPGIELVLVHVGFAVDKVAL